MTLSNSATAGTVYLGTLDGVTASNGYPLLAATSLTIPGYAGSAGAAIHARASSGTITTGILVSNGQ
ncbi:MAG TPA: hypothetical protein VGS19_29220 [Streptosporangiaceae bacterium]|nr:hypothetical protein [Streptosporangiaceae bacterium]